MKKLIVKICKDNQEPMFATYPFVKNVDLFMESLSHDLSEKGFYIDRVYYGTKRS